MGNPSSKSAQMGNVLTARTMILLLVASALGVWVVLEQPSTSLMEFHVLFQRFLKLVPMRVLSIQMADYGSPTSKPTLLYSSNLANNAFDKFLFARSFEFGLCFKQFSSRESYLWIPFGFIQGHDAIDLLPSYKTKRKLEEKDMVRHYIDSKGRPRVCGGRDLKSSQAYPRQCLYTY